ncbi:S4 domain-containing protein [Porphyromonas gingivicanis]|uniref:S4 domain-containing protein n=1 Tax=Porphyromonas gingivicanis TaxID=266762 RepID=UPI0011DE0880|nr:S4 domain-containing protein [Porphyromonas gingivicanis]
MRINKLLSETGLGSRREVEQLIIEGRVTVNGVLAELTDIIEEEDVVTLDAKNCLYET